MHDVLPLGSGTETLLLNLQGTPTDEDVRARKESWHTRTFRGIPGASTTQGRADTRRLSDSSSAQLAEEVYEDIKRAEQAGVSNQIARLGSSLFDAALMRSASSGLHPVTPSSLLSGAATPDACGQGDRALEAGHARRFSADQATAGAAQAADVASGTHAATRRSAESAPAGSATVNAPLGLEDMLPGRRRRLPILAKHADPPGTPDGQEHHPQPPQSCSHYSSKPQEFWHSAVKVAPPAAREAARLLNSHQIPPGSMAERYLQLLAGNAEPGGAEAADSRSGRADACPKHMTYASTNGALGTSTEGLGHSRRGESSGNPRADPSSSRADAHPGSGSPAAAAAAAAARPPKSSFEGLSNSSRERNSSTGAIVRSSMEGLGHGRSGTAETLSSSSQSLGSQFSHRSSTDARDARIVAEEQGDTLQSLYAVLGNRFVPCPSLAILLKLHLSEDCVRHDCGTLCSSFITALANKLDVLFLFVSRRRPRSLTGTFDTLGAATLQGASVPLPQTLDQHRLLRDGLKEIDRGVSIELSSSPFGGFTAFSDSMTDAMREKLSTYRSGPAEGVSLPTMKHSL